MAEVKRHDLIVEPFSWTDETKEDDYNPALREATAGLVVYASDHDREVTRLQRARARNLVKVLRLRASLIHEREGGWVGCWERHDTLQSLADRIAAKYLGKR